MNCQVVYYFKIRNIGCYQLKHFIIFHYKTDLMFTFTIDSFLICCIGQPHVLFIPDIIQELIWIYSY